MGREAQLVLAVVTAPPGRVLLVHRPGEWPPAILPGGRPQARESPGATAERGCLEEAGVEIRAGRQLGRLLNDGIATIYVAARPVHEVDPEEIPISVRAGWYTLDQVDLVIPDLWAPVRHHLSKTIRR
ncbi:NUDIX hydrolase [Actinomycetospora chibensis]|uniref:NUDIX hydrolase n=1 Tax=Actinomycetospora chibensis TaxID=663606 RepID=A0ABV9RTD0_9PSEU|nr:NUDIX hydrolase [Actinomycetospora chibensis]MDD7924430.1 NUDIX hydrolase [Actinomycetospora chibensis]